MKRFAPFSVTGHGSKKSSGIAASRYSHAFSTHNSQVNCCRNQSQIRWNHTTRAPQMKPYSKSTQPRSFSTCITPNSRPASSPSLLLLQNNQKDPTLHTLVKMTNQLWNLTQKRNQSTDSSQKQNHETQDSSQNNDNSSGNNNNSDGNSSNVLLYGTIVAALAILGGAGAVYLYFNEETEISEASLKKMEEEREMEQCSADEILDRLFREMEQEAAEDQIQWSLWTYFKLFMRSLSLSIRIMPLLLFTPVLWLGENYHIYWYRLLVKTMRSCGACFIKLGQWMATRPDLFPRELCLLLGELHSSGDRHRFRATKRILAKSLGRPIEEVFEEFDKKELASGAIAQIYKAKLSQNIMDELDIQLKSPYVAVKVRHPQVKEELVNDLKIIRAITAFLGRFQYFKFLNLEENVVVFSKNMKAQLNLRAEADNLRLFRHNFREVEHINFPEPVEQLSSPQVLVESFEEGIPISEFTALRDSSTKHFKEQLARLGIVLYLKMLVIDSFLHADLHPGNLFVKLEQDKETGDLSPTLVVLDAGLVCALTPTDRANFIDLFNAITRKNGREVARLMITRSKTYRHRDMDTLSQAEKDRLEGFIDEMDVLVQDVIDLPFGEVQIGSTMSKVLELGRQYHVPVEANFTTLVIGSIVIEGLGRQLNPELRFVDEAKPMLAQVKELQAAWVKNRFSEMWEQSKFKMGDIFKDVERAEKWLDIIPRNCEEKEE